MTHAVQRPSRDTGPDAAILGDHFQIAYVTTDLDRAMEVMGARYGLKDFSSNGGEMPGGGHIRIALAWRGGVMYELVQAEGPAAAFYNARLPAQGFAIRHHHLGYLLESEAEWEALEAKIAREGWPIVFRTEMRGFMRALYIEAAELGHYLEYILPEPAGVEFFETTPVS